MADEPSDEAKALWRKTLESVGEGHLADKDEISVKDAFRLQHELELSVATAPREFRFAYSLRDIEQLSDMTREAWNKLFAEWRKHHRIHEGMSVPGLVVWGAAAALAWVCLGHPAWAVDLLSQWWPATPSWAGKIPGWILLLCVVVSGPAAFATIFSSVYWDSYSAGYTDGLAEGVKRTLRITDEEQKEMWEDLTTASCAEGILGPPSMKKPSP
jgi:hypothetical protein